MTNEDILLFSIGATKSSFFAIHVHATLTATQGIKIGSGKCKAVRLRLNALTRDTQTAIFSVDGVQNQGCFYLGDANRQEYEVLAGTDSPLILCNDLSEVWVRFPPYLYVAPAGAIQVIVYD